VGRWFEEDPKGLAAGDPNLFRSVNKRPTTATDPSGLIIDPRAELTQRPRPPIGLGVLNRE
jgi:hypothetical protein